MSWVMVPVPEELADQVSMFVFQLKFRAEVPKWNDILMREHLASLADEPRAVLCAVAAGVRARDPIQDVHLAERMGVALPEVLGLVREANDVALDVPGDLVHSRRENRDDGAGGTQPCRVLYMLDDLAKLVGTAEQDLGLLRSSSPAT